MFSATLSFPCGVALTGMEVYHGLLACLAEDGSQWLAVSRRLKVLYSIKRIETKKLRSSLQQIAKISPIWIAWHCCLMGKNSISGGSMRVNEQTEQSVNSGLMTRSVVAVIVLYATEIADCVSLRSLVHAAAQLPPGILKLRIHLHDNTPGRAADPSCALHSLCEVSGFPLGMVSYRQDPQNSGLATAYNRALSIAHDEGHEWLLTLDQDTVLPADSLLTLLDTMALLDERPDVAAIVPQIRSGGRIVSPNWFLGGGWPRWFLPGYTGIPMQTTFAFNSGSVLRVAALMQAGGYSPWFWLDNSDANMYRQLAKLGKRVYVCGKMELAHDFSMQNMQQKVSPARYRTILLAESAFWDLERNAFAGMERTVRLAVRMVKHLLRRDRAELRRLTLDALRLRLFHSRRYRIARWREMTAPIIARFDKPDPRSARPKVSVCMATYNGHRFVREQLESIAAQLSGEDEIIIIDDQSKDATLRLLKQFRAELALKAGSPRILLSEHAEIAASYAHLKRRCARLPAAFFSSRTTMTGGLRTR